MRALALVSALALAACATSSSSTSPPQAVKTKPAPKAVIPPVTEAPDAALFGWVRLRRPLELVRALGASATYEKVKANVPLTGIDDRPVVLFVWDGGPGLPAVPDAGAIVPKSADDLLRLALQKEMPMKDAGQSMLVGVSPRGLPHFGAAHETFAASPMAPHLEIVIKGGPLRARYGMAIKAGIAYLQQQKPETFSTGEGAAKLIEWIETFEELRIGLVATPTAVELDIVSHMPNDKPQAPPTPYEPLIRYLPATHVRYELDGAALGEAMGSWMVNGVDQLTSSPGGAAQQLRESVRKLGKAGAGLRFAVTLTERVDTGFGTAMIGAGDTAAAYYAQLQDIYRIYEDPKSNADLAAAGFTVKLVAQRRMRTHKGVAIDRFDVDVMSAKLNADPATREIAHKMRHQVYDLAQFGRYVVSTTADSPGGIEAILDALMNKRPIAPALEVHTIYPESASATGEVALQPMVDWVQAIAGGQFKLGKVVVPGTLYFHAAHDGGAARYRLQVPRATFEGFSRTPPAQ